MNSDYAGMNSEQEDAMKPNDSKTKGGHMIYDYIEDSDNFENPLAFYEWKERINSLTKNMSIVEWFTYRRPLNNCFRKFLMELFSISQSNYVFFVLVLCYVNS